MRRISFLLYTLILLFCTANLSAQNNDKDADESLYLEGVVPEKDGRVVFSREFQIPGMPEQEIYNRMLKWMEVRLAENNNELSRVVYTNPETGQIIGRGEQWIVFKSSALSLDRTLINYQLTVSCKAEFCTVEIEKIRYLYRENEKYVAEGWITDNFALNKSKTKLIKGVSKWRIKTVDFANDIFKGAALALSVSDIKQVTQTESEQRKVQSGPVVIQQTTQATTSQPVKQTETVAPKATSDLVEINPANVPTNLIKASEGKIVIAIGSDQFNRTMMTADAGGSIVKIENEMAVMTTLAPDQAYEALQKAPKYTVMFYPNGQTEPSAVFECESINTGQTYIDGLPRSYFGKIIKAQIRE